MLASWCDSRTLCELFNRMTAEGNYEWRFHGVDGAERRLRITWATDEEPGLLGGDQRADRARNIARSLPHGRLPHGAGDVDRTDARAVGGVGSSQPAVVPAGARSPSLPELERLAAWRRATPSYATVPLPSKHRMMAACVSAKYFDPGHIRRIDFLRFLDRQDLDLDIYGAPENRFRRWRSRTPDARQGSALLPYRYYFDAENHSVPELLHREDRRLPARRDAVLLLGLPEPRLVLRPARIHPARA